MAHVIGGLRYLVCHLLLGSIECARLLDMEEGTANNKISEIIHVIDDKGSRIASNRSTPGFRP
jgi:hypothetical protein